MFKATYIFKEVKEKLTDGYPCHYFFLLVWSLFYSFERIIFVATVKDVKNHVRSLTTVGHQINGETGFTKCCIVNKRTKFEKIPLMKRPFWEMS